MRSYESLSHSKWECKYHVVFIPKCRRKTLYVELRRHLGDVFRKLAEQRKAKSRKVIFCRITRTCRPDLPEARSVAGDRFYRERARSTWLVYTGRRSETS